MKNNGYSSKMLWVSLLLVLISMIGASFIQTSGYRVEVKDLRWETESGHQMSALLYIPDSATKESPAPGIVTSHGWYNTREMQDLNYVEFARRGFVVLAIDMYGHGNSDPIKPEDWKLQGTGMYDAVELMAKLPYVDTQKISVTGHSNGARASNWSIIEDNKKSKDQQLISSVLLIANDAMYTSDPQEPLYWRQRNASQLYTNNYGARDVGLIAAQYDEFFFRSKKEDGTVTPPREYIHTEYAQSFLSFGQKPNMAEPKVQDQFYQQEIDGKMALRIIYTPNQIHPWNHFSATVVKDTLAYFDRSISTPNPISNDDQIWQYKVAFNFLGVIGFFMFVIAITKALLQTSYFNPLKLTTELSIQAIPNISGKLWFWGTAVIGVLVSAAAYIGVYHWSMNNRPDFLLQPQVYYIAVWSSVMGAFSLLMALISYFVIAKNQGMKLGENGVWISFYQLWKTIILALIVTSLSFMLVFLADYFFKTDFRIWIITIKAFTPDKILLALYYFPFFLLFYMANSIIVNCFSYVKMTEKVWVNTALMMSLNGLSSAILVAIQYTNFYITGDIFFTSVSPIVGIWLFPMIVMIPLGALITRCIYDETKNPYLGGLIYSMIISLLMVSNTLTQLS
ncbi:dienelactone hydrolase family protein [Vibrio hibernica]|uniref:dienelactone hydrolase family protein n=1 Tax=Vibrio hibernica TaxID=2587465 RepID=UPI0039AF8E14